MTLGVDDILKHLLAALAAGAFIGTERSFHGRAAGFRTHALVCVASSMLMLVSVYQAYWFPVSSTDGVRMDPTRMAQGIMTGIGFLGAGVIFKEGMTVRGLTTAASIWSTAAIGVLMGTGLYKAGAIATIIIFGILSVFRQVEMRFPTQLYASLTVRFARAATMREPEVRTLLAEQGFKISSVSYELLHDPQEFEYRISIRTVKTQNLARLAEALDAHPSVRGFEVVPTSDK
jgi:putative Mg2+ transporter-C (MgtC) family protein